MILNKKNIKRNHILLLLSITVVTYAISSLLTYYAAVNLSVATTMIAMRIGFLIGALIFLFLSKDKIDLKLSRSGAVSWIYGISFTVVGLLLYTAYKSFSLASIYPLTGAGTIVFLALDLIFHRKKLSSRIISLLLIGVLAVFIGSYLAQSTGLTFNMAALPYAVGIIVSAGVGYYALANSTKTVTEGSKQLAWAIPGLILGVAMFLFYHVSFVPNMQTLGLFFIGILAGLFLCVAFAMEIRAVKYGSTGNERHDVVLRQFINNFATIDILVILLASVAINSYTVDALVGGLLIAIGVLVLGTVQ
jgi:glucose uptake protein GlcU